MAGLLTVNYGWIVTNHSCGKLFGVIRRGAKLHKASKFRTRALASRKSAKKVKRGGKMSLSEESKKLSDKSVAEIGLHTDSTSASSTDNGNTKKTVIVASRGNVLQACTVTSALIAALGIVIREVSHVASVKGYPIPDCPTEVSYGFELWHLGLISGSVILISSCRYLLLKTWKDFAESSEAANQQVLSSLEPLDYLVVAFLPGVSEELLFRGALLPLFGIDWKSCLVVATIFGVLHLGSGRKYSFAVWATFVGLVYGYATVVSRSLLVPIVAHALNNLIGGILWRTSKSLD